jgi:hypothetical protein
MKNKMFGQNIQPDCSYCENSATENSFAYCNKGKQLKNGKCRKFEYDPLMRVPKNSVFKRKYTEQDFKI